MAIEVGKHGDGGIGSNSNAKNNENDIDSIEVEKDDVIWVWNNIVTRDKMRRKSVAGTMPAVIYERSKSIRYQIASKIIKNVIK